MTGLPEQPKARSLEVHPSASRPGAFELLDPTGFCPGVLTVSPATLYILSRMNGSRTRAEIQADYMLRFARMLFSDELDDLIEQLDDGLCLASPRFEARRAASVAEYRGARVRKLRDPAPMGTSATRLSTFLSNLLDRPCGGGAAPVAEPDGASLAGLIAPHLDYERGAPCYAAAYADLPRRTQATRFVILGTNHFGVSASVVGTRKDFDTPLGAVPHDGDLMRRLDQRCGVDLCEEEFDHVREHSVEPQVVLLKHLLPDRPFTIAPYLCPDPCGPNGTRPRDGRGADLKTFAEALGAVLAEGNGSICVIAGADLSHIGRYFQDDRDLDPSTLQEVERHDRWALDAVLGDEPETFVSRVRGRSNSTNICSVGCIYALASALHGRAKPRLLNYHQAVSAELENCVTCAAMHFENAS